MFNLCGHSLSFLFYPEFIGPYYIWKEEALRNNWKHNDPISHWRCTDVFSAGKLTDIHGNALQYNKEVKHMNSAGVLATLRNYDYYASRVPQSVKNALVPWREIKDLHLERAHFTTNWMTPELHSPLMTVLSSYLGVEREF